MEEALKNIREAIDLYLDTEIGEINNKGRIMSLKV